MWTKFDYQNPPPNGDYWLKIEARYDIALAAAEAGSTIPARLGSAFLYGKEENDEGEGTGFDESNRGYPPPNELERVTHYMLIAVPELPKDGEDGLSAQSLHELALLQAFQRGRLDGAAEERARLLAPFVEIGKLLSEMKDG